jgi:hypothetical protein
VAPSGGGIWQFRVLPRNFKPGFYFIEHRNKTKASMTPRLAWLQLLAALGLHGAAQKPCAKMPPLAPLAVFGGREGMALSLGSVLAAAIALFLPHSMAHARPSVAKMGPCKAIALSHDGATLFCVDEQTLTVLDAKSERVRARTVLASLRVSLPDKIKITVTRDDTVILVHETGLVHLRPPRWNVPEVETLDEGCIYAACISPLNTLVLSVEGGPLQSRGLVCRSSSHLVRWIQRSVELAKPYRLCALTFRGVACVAARDYTGIEVFRASNGKSMGKLACHNGGITRSVYLWCNDHFLTNSCGEMAYCAGTDELLLVDCGHLYALALHTMIVRKLTCGEGRETAVCVMATHDTTVWFGDDTGVRVFDLWK